LTVREKRQLELARLSLEDLNRKRASLDEMPDRPYFLWHLFFHDVLSKGGFDIVIGNPPFVRADNPSQEHQRKAILACGDYETLWEKWDLYVAFIEKGFKLLRPEGTLALITSDAYCHAKYAQKSQEWFLRHARVDRVDFLGDLQVFEAAVRNVIFFYTHTDGSANVPERRLHKGAFGNVTLLPSDKQSKLTSRAFFPETKTVCEFTALILPIESICYVSFGCRPNSDEKHAKGLFVASDLVSSVKDKDHPKRYIEAKDIDKWSYQQSRWLEWGTNRSPALLARQTFAELYDVPEKIVAADVSGAENRAAYDVMQVFHSHTLISFVPWHSLAGVCNNSLKKAARYVGETPPRPDLPRREELEATSRRFFVKYLLAVMNSSVARDFLRANRRSNIHLYPDDWKNLPIPDVSLSCQQPLVTLVDRILAAKTADPTADISALEVELDHLVYDLYGLTAPKIKPIGESKHLVRTVKVAFPSTDAEKVLCSVVLQAVNRLGEISAADLTHVLLFTAHPERACALLDLPEDAVQIAHIDAAKHADLNAFQIRSSLERRQAIIVTPSASGLIVLPGPEIGDTLIWLKRNVGEWPNYAAKAVKAYHSLIDAPRTATKRQKDVLAIELTDFSAMIRSWEVVHA
jgi:hypothetical protein